MKSGTTLADDEDVSSMEHGGMVEGWRAPDTKLGREAVVRTLPEEPAFDPDRPARFEREAKPPHH